MSDPVLPWHAPDIEIPSADHLFSKLALQTLYRKLGSAKRIDISVLQADLRGLARQYFVIVRTSPLGFKGGPPHCTLDQRTRWLVANILNPAAKLIAALQSEPHMLAHWPDEIMGDAPDRTVLLEQLSRLSSCARQVSTSLTDRKGDGNEILTIVKAEFAAALTDIFTKHFPDLRAAREYIDRAGDPDLRSPFAIFVSACAKEIFGGELTIPGRLLDDMGILHGED